MKHMISAAILLLAAGLSAAGAEAAAPLYPQKPIRLIVPFGPGGVGDITARIVAQKMSAAMGQQFVIDNRPSAGGIVASEIVAKAEPDGYTLLLMNNQNAISAALFRKLPYDPVKDFTPISTLAAFSIVILVNPRSPAKSLGDLIALAKGHPGKFNIGTVNVGSTQHLAAELFKSMAGLDMVTVPYNNTGAVIAALQGDNVQAAFEFLPAVLGQIRAGSLRALAATPATRFAVLPNVPTVIESGVPGYQVTSWNGVAAPAKTPKAIVERLNREIRTAVSSPDVKKRFEELSAQQNPSTPEDMRKLLVSEIAKWNAVIDKAKIQRH